MKNAYVHVAKYVQSIAADWLHCNKSRNLLKASIRRWLVTVGHVRISKQSTLYRLT